MSINHLKDSLPDLQPGTMVLARRKPIGIKLLPKYRLTFDWVR
jgi:hypothetical protein